MIDFIVARALYSMQLLSTSDGAFPRKPFIAWEVLGF